MAPVLQPALVLWWRELTRFRRQRSRWIGALGTPLIFWLLIGSGIGASFRPPAGSGSINYLEYFFPGTVLLVVLFTAIFSTFSVIEDRREGFLLSVLVAPVSRLAIVLGKVLGGTTIALVQGLLLLLLAPFVGFRLEPVSVLVLIFGTFAVALWLTSLGFGLAWRINSSSGFHSVMNLVLIPLWLLSGALFPPAGASKWVQWIMAVNPLTYGLALLRRGLYWSESDPAGYSPQIPVSAAVTLVCVVLTMFFSTRVIRPETGK
ncbi:MAG: multidrug ABC transporter permease [Acidobacteria bacterium]|nr:MAG: multidrug ABC transporter permease [Acidobacteriota bacterium]